MRGPSFSGDQEPALWLVEQYRILALTEATLPLHREGLGVTQAAALAPSPACPGKTGPAQKT